jgi:hypothetical protein
MSQRQVPLRVGKSIHDSNEVRRKAIPVVLAERHPMAIGTQLAP